MVRHEGMPNLVARGCVRAWTFAGYGPPVPVSPAVPIVVLTPPATVSTLAAGYRPILHPSALAVG